MESDITLFLAIEKMMQARMFLHQGKLAVKDIDLAVIYDVNILELRTIIKKNRLRFPPDFMVEISNGEFAFTEPGILMLGGLLRSDRAKRSSQEVYDQGIKSGLASANIYPQLKYRQVHCN